MIKAIQRVLLALVAIAAVPAAAHAADLCTEIVNASTTASGKMDLKTDMSTDGCTATLKGDLVIDAKGGKITSGAHGVTFKLNGHKLTLNGVRFEFSGDFAVAVHGTDHPTKETVAFTNVVVKDLKNTTCKAAKDRFGVILWKVMNATLSKITVADVKVRHGIMFIAPLPTSSATLLPGTNTAPQGTANITGTVAYCQGKWSPEQAIFMYGRQSLVWNGKPVMDSMSVGPRDWPKGLPIVLRDLGHP